MNDNFYSDISSIGNDKNKSNGYYYRLTEYIEGEGLLDDEDCQELINRIESFIEQEIQEIRHKNGHYYCPLNS